MKGRIQRILEEENMSPSRFADEVGLNRPTVSHILSGRNNPGLEVIQKILHRFPHINASWLVTGVGSMYENSLAGEFTSPTLFDEISTEQATDKDKSNYEKEIASKNSKNIVKTDENQSSIIIKQSVIKVKKIALFYADNTYEEFIPAEKSRI